MLAVALQRVGFCRKSDASALYFFFGGLLGVRLFSLRLGLRLRLCSAGSGPLGGGAKSWRQPLHRLLRFRHLHRGTDSGNLHVRTADDLVEHLLRFFLLDRGLRFIARGLRRTKRIGAGIADQNMTRVHLLFRLAVFRFGLAFFELDDVETKLALDYVADLAGLQRISAFSNSGTMSPAPNQPRSPPLSLLPSVENSFAKLAKSSPLEDASKLLQPVRDSVCPCRVRDGSQGIASTSSSVAFILSCNLSTAYFCASTRACLQHHLQPYCRFLVETLFYRFRLRRYRSRPKSLLEHVELLGWNLLCSKLRVLLLASAMI